jgi:hypothetical protein
MIELRGNRFGIKHSPEEILEILKEVADIYGLSSQYRQSYYIWDHTTVRRIDWFSPPSMKRFLGAWRRQGFPELIASSCGADFIRVKNHYLGFYPRKGKLIKVFLDLDAFQSHIEGAGRFNDLRFKCISAPSIHHKALEPIHHTVEEYIPGKNFLELPLNLSKEHLEELACFHFDHTDLIRIELGAQERTRISKILHDFDLEQDHSSILMGILDKESWQVIHGEVHGDLSPGNLIQGRDKVFITDWEGYSRGPIARDLVKIYRSAGSTLRSWILDVYQKQQDSIKVGGKADRFGHVMLLFALRLLPSIYSPSLDQFSSVLKDEEQIKHKTRRDAGSLKETLLSLLDHY